LPRDNETNFPDHHPITHRGFLPGGSSMFLDSTDDDRNGPKPDDQVRVQQLVMTLYALCRKNWKAVAAAADVDRGTIRRWLKRLPRDRVKVIETLELALEQRASRIVGKDHTVHVAGPEPAPVAQLRSQIELANFLMTINLEFRAQKLFQDVCDLCDGFMSALKDPLILQKIHACKAAALTGLGQLVAASNLYAQAAFGMSELGEHVQAYRYEQAQTFLKAKGAWLAHLRPADPMPMHEMHVILNECLALAEKTPPVDSNDDVNKAVRNQHYGIRVMLYSMLKDRNRFAKCIHEMNGDDIYQVGRALNEAKRACESNADGEYDVALRWIKYWT
jgi:hypothetical protein